MPTIHRPIDLQADSRSDAELMHLIQARKQWALEVLFKRYLARGIWYAQSAGVDHQTAEDIVADAFIKIWNQAEKFQAVRGSFGGWFHTIVHNLAIDELRRMNTRSNAQVKSFLQTEKFGSDDSEFTQEVERIQIRSALTELPQAQRDLLQMAYLEGLSRREIARRLALPLGTVHTRLRLGKEKLKHLLQESQPQAPLRASYGELKA